mgnify:FL=1
MRRLGAVPRKTLVILLVAVILLPNVSYIVLSATTGKIGILDISFPVVEVADRDHVLDLIDRAAGGDIKAVVLRVDSEGGVVSYIQEAYRGVLKLQEKKPIVACIVGLGVSGSYHIAIASSWIYTEPFSFIGNIGVIGRLPEKLYPIETRIETGPYKLTGISEKNFPLMVQEAFESFLNEVLAQRGERLKVDKVELSKGLIYTGAEAIKLGLADEIGSSLDAVQKAAGLARLLKYEVVNINRLVKSSRNTFASRAVLAKNLDMLNPPPAIYYMFLPSLSVLSREYSTLYAKSTPPSRQAVVPPNATLGTFLVDDAHRNAFDRDELNVLLTEAVSRGYTISYAEYGADFREKLPKAKALIIINPTYPFTEGEIDLVKVFVEGGGKVLLIAEVARIFMREINTLSAEFGMVFGEGYLYNLVENYGNYRNIVVTGLANASITRNLRTIVLYLATSISGRASPIAYTTETTVYSGSERPGRYAVISSNKYIVAIADFTFLTEPFCYVEDNYKLLTNIIEFLIQS